MAVFWIQILVVWLTAVEHLRLKHRCPACMNDLVVQAMRQIQKGKKDARENLGTCDAHAMHMRLLSAAGGPSCKELYKMASRITGCREEKWYDALIATHVHSKPKLATKTWA